MSPATAPRSFPTPWLVWWARSNATYGTPAGGCTCLARVRNKRCGCAGRPMSCTSAGAARPPPLSSPSTLRWLRAAGSRLEVSRDQPAGDEGDLRLGDLVPALGAREEPEDLLALPGLVSTLPALEREVIMLRFFQELDQDAIAARVGFSQMHVSRLQRRALARMRAQLVEPRAHPRKADR